MRTILTASGILAACGVALALSPTIDGIGIDNANWGAGLAVQNTNTQFGNNFNELDQLFVTSDTANVYVGLTGNIADNNAIVVFFDTVAQPANPAGEVITTTSLGMPCPAGPVPTLVQMYSGTTMEPGFNPEFALLISVGLFPGQSTSQLVYATDLVNIGALTTEVLGIGAVGTGNGNLTGNSGAAVAVNNSNTGGIDCWDNGSDPNNPCSGPNADPGAAAGVTTGIEIKIPKTLLGISGAPTIRVFANLSNNAQGGGSGPCGREGFSSNQALPGVGGFGNLASFSPNGPFLLNFVNVPGTQFVSVTLPQ
ncbi:MAG: hypothetical protein ACKVS9_02235 [Phycisphaerae bacterium]